MTVVETETRTIAEQTVRDVLHRAADLLEEFGWCQGSAAIEEDGSPIGMDSLRWGSARKIAYCHNGAIGQACDDYGISYPNPMRAAVHVQVGDVCTAYRWNDAPGRTKAEVVARLREAAEAAS